MAALNKLQNAGVTHAYSSVLHIFVKILNSYLARIAIGALIVFLFIRLHDRHKKKKRVRIAFWFDVILALVIGLTLFIAIVDQTTHLWASIKDVQEVTIETKNAPPRGSSMSSTPRFTSAMPFSGAQKNAYRYIPPPPRRTTPDFPFSDSPRKVRFPSPTKISAIDRKKEGIEKLLRQYHQNPDRPGLLDAAKSNIDQLCSMSPDACASFMARYKNLKN